MSGVASRSIRLAVTKNAENARDKLLDLAIQAETGQLIGFCGVAELAGGSYMLVGSSTLSRLQTAGALLDAAVGRLQQED